MVYHVHPRSIRGNTHKPRYKGAAVTNYDWLLYCLLQRYFKRQPGLCDQITFQIPEAFDVRYKVFNRRFMLTHGDRLGARGGDGFIGAMGPIMRGESKIRGISGALGIDYDHLLVCHYHQYLELPHDRGFVNGSLKGYDEYCLGNRFMPAPPIQALFFVEPKRIGSREPIYLEDPHDHGPAAWLSVPAG